ncbi:hypothetical protein ACWKWJ_17215, partial [Sphingopyxis terrae subsp. ummariensis]
MVADRLAVGFFCFYLFIIGQVADFMCFLGGFFVFVFFFGGCNARPPRVVFGGYFFWGFCGGVGVGVGVFKNP